MTKVSGAPRRTAFVYKMQANTKEAAQQLINDSLEVQHAGAVMIVLEAVPSDLAKVIAEKVEL